MTDQPPITRRSLPDRIRYFATQLTERAAADDDMELGGMAIALGMVANDAQQEKPPTTWAYQQACTALWEHRQRADEAEAERDRLAELLGTVTTLAFAAPVRPEVRLSRIRELLDPADQATEEPTP